MIGPIDIPMGRSLTFPKILISPSSVRTRTIAAVTLAVAGRIALLVAQMLGQFRPKRPLNQSLLGLLEKPVFPQSGRQVVVPAAQVQSSNSSSSPAFSYRADLNYLHVASDTLGVATGRDYSPPKVVKAPRAAQHFLIPPSHLFQLPFTLPLLVAEQLLPLPLFLFVYPLLHLHFRVPEVILKAEIVRPLCVPSSWN
jgi:hypothetical protein